MESYKNQKSSLEHLNLGVSPIMACIGTREDFDKETGLTDRLGYWGENPQTLLVDYYADSYENSLKKIRNAGTKTYAISDISDLNKFSLKYANCTGVIVAGQDKITGKNISFFTHQDPTIILPEGLDSDLFRGDLKRSLKKLRDRSVPGTIDAVIFGGNYLDSDKEEEKNKQAQKEKRSLPSPRVEFEKNYKDSISLLSTQISDVLGFEPTVIAGPKTMIGRDDAIYDNEHRRLYLRRPEIGDKSSESFSPQEMNEREEGWRKEWK